VQTCDNDCICLKATIPYTKNNVRKILNPPAQNCVRKMEITFTKDHLSCQEN
jgi:hypothetical protein